MHNDLKYTYFFTDLKMFIARMRHIRESNVIVSSNQGTYYTACKLIFLNNDIFLLLLKIPQNVLWISVCHLMIVLQQKNELVLYLYA